MKRETISRAVGNISDLYIQEAAEYSGAKKGVRRPFWTKAAATAVIFCVLVCGIIMLFPFHESRVTVYARETDEEITAAGAVLYTGTISDTGEMKGHPLMFYLSGEDIAYVRFSCKNQQINFMDWTEKRDEYGNARNFTVPYGEDKSEYYYLTINWIPVDTIRELTDNAGSSIATLPEEMRSDIIVLEIVFGSGRRETKAIRVSLLDDGTFFASCDDYKISEADSFVERPDSQAIPRDILYAQGSQVSDHSGDAAPMICVNGRLYQRSTDQKDPYDGPEDEFVYLGRIESELSDSQNDEGGTSGGSTSDGVPRENFQANHPVTGAEVYQYKDDVMVKIDGEFWLYELLELRDAPDMENSLSEEEKMQLDPTYGQSPQDKP